MADSLAEQQKVADRHAATRKGSKPDPAARGVLAVLGGTRKATASHGGCRDGNRVCAEPRGSGYLDWRPYEYFTCHLSRVEAEGVEHTFVEGLETCEFIDLGDGRTEHRWLLRADDRTPEGLRAFEESNAFLKEISTHATWGDQMRRPIAEDEAMYGLDRPVD